MGLSPRPDPAMTVLVPGATGSDARVARMRRSVYFRGVVAGGSSAV
jgi:hypothetical protein